MDDIIGHLSYQFSKAAPVLFTGAGFSCAARNIKGENLPTGGQLKQQLWNLCFPQKSFDGESSLQDLFEVAKARHSTQLKRFLTETFTVDSGTLPAWYELVFSLPWHRIYTLNIDDLAIAAQRRFKLTRPLTPISANTGKLRSLDTVSANRVDYVYINGSIDDAPEHVTFSVSQYAERLSRDQPWYSQLVEDLLTHPIVFIGTQLDEPPLWQYIQKRLDRGGSKLEELRPKSYLVSRSLPEARQITLRQHNVVFFAADAETFANNVLLRVTESARIGHSLLGSSIESSNLQVLEEVSRLAVAATKGVSDYLFGAEPTWDDIRANRAIYRDCDRELGDTFSRQRIQGQLSGFILVEGTAGTGKSTLLKRLALTLAANEAVAWVDQFSGTTPRTIVDGMRAPASPRVLFIDDADVYGSEINSIVCDVCTGPNFPIVVISITSARVDRVINPAVLSSIPSSTLVVPNLEDRDIAELLSVLERENCLGTLLPKSQEERLRILRHKCDRQLLVAMIEATSDEDFESKIAEEYSSMDAETRKVYATVALATGQRFDLTRHEILLSIDGLKNSTLNALEMLVRRRLVYKIRGGTYILRHHVIAEELVRQLGKQHELGGLILDLTWAVAAELDDFYSNNSPKRRLVKRLINHDFLRDTVGFEEAQHYYLQLEKALSQDFNYWLQRGSLELEQHRLEAAERYINNARGINARDLNTQTEFAYLLLLKAIENPRNSDAPTLVQDAENMLRANIAARGDRDPHSYHVLVGQMIRWVRTGVVRSREGQSISHSLRTTLTDGLRRHPKNDHLRLLDQQLEEELRVGRLRS